MRRLDEKIGMLVDALIANEERFAALADSQRHSDEKLAALIYIVRRQKNGQA